MAEENFENNSSSIMNNDTKVNNIKRSASLLYMPIREMYNVATRTHAAWGIEGYEIQKKYFDPKKVEEDKLYEEMRKTGKAIKNQKHITKKGCFLDDEYSCQKNKPGPQKYDVTHKWISEADIEKGKKRPKDTKRETFIEAIFLEQKRRGVPGPGKYNVTKTEEQIKADVEKATKKIKFGEKMNYLQDYEFVSNTIPGPGSFNPRQILPKLHKDLKNPDKWIAFHKEQAKKQGKSTLPGVGSYKKDFPLDYDTFAKTFSKMIEEPNKKESVHHLGTEERFKDAKKSKSKSILIVPGPGTYPMIPKWPGKDKPKNKDVKEKNWMNSISTGIQRSIYYSNDC